MYTPLICLLVCLGCLSLLLLPLLQNVKKPFGFPPFWRGFSQLFRRMQLEERLGGKYVQGGAFKGERPDARLPHKITLVDGTVCRMHVRQADPTDEA